MLGTGAGVDQIPGKIEGSGLGQAHPLVGKILGGLAQGVAKLGDVGLSLLPQRWQSICRGPNITTWLNCTG